MVNNLRKISKFNILLLLLGLSVGWFANNFYYANFYDVEAALERLGVSDEEPSLFRIETTSCNSSSEANENQSCENLYDFTSEGWEDDGKNCKDQWIELNFSEEQYVEFVVLQNYQYEGLFAQKDKIKDLKIISDKGTSVTHTLENSTDSQWIDVNFNASSLRFEILSNYETLGVENCHLESIDIFGRK